MNAHASARPDPRTPNHAVDAAGIPTCIRGLVGAAVTVVVVATAGLFGVSAYRRPVAHSVLMTSSARPTTREVQTTPSAHTADAVADFDAVGEVTDSSESAAAGPYELDATHGVLELPPAAEGHRVWVDGHLVVVASSRIAVACGRHVVKIGSRGRERQVVVPCGADRFVAYP
jgi:hypothetical protein